MSLVEKLTAEELAAITEYRKMYAVKEEANCPTSSYASSADILQVWSSAKSEYLYKVFDNELIISKEVEYGKSYEDLIEDWYAALNNADKNRKAKAFIDNYRQKITSLNDLEKINGSLYINLMSLIHDGAIVDGVYTHDTFEFINPKTEKKIRVQTGAKIMKILAKVVDAFDLSADEFEAFRICQSQLLNQKTLSGKLVLSIHPLDYMTMSDNDYGWESCMSWQYYGGYRQGTVEMMNSPCVVVAYLDGERPMYLYTAGDERLPWSNKKWRSLFIVHDSLIASIKDYPYANDDLTKMAFEMLRELAEKNCGWSYEENQCINHCRNEVKANGQDFDLVFTTDRMYNDFGARHCHYLCLASDFSVDEIDEDFYYARNYNETITELRFNYSGVGQCMVCGSTDDSFDDESCLACCDCQVLHWCEHCESYCSEIHEVDGVYLCNDCYENATRQCDYCNEYHYENIMTPVYIVRKLNEKEAFEARVAEMERYPDFYDTFKKKENTKEVVRMRVDSPDFHLCSEDIYGWVEKNLNVDGVMHKISQRWEEYHFVYWDDLTDAAKSRFFGGIEKQSILDVEDMMWTKTLLAKTIEDI